MTRWQFSGVPYTGCKQFQHQSQVQVGFAKVREVQDGPATRHLSGASQRQSDTTQEARAQDSLPRASTPSAKESTTTRTPELRPPATEEVACPQATENACWRDKVTGWTMCDRDTEIPPRGACPWDYVIAGAGMAIWHKGTERFVSCAPMQVGPQMDTLSTYASC